MSSRRIKEVRIFLAGVVCGLLAAMIPAGMLAWRYTRPHAEQVSRQQERDSSNTPVDWADGMAAPRPGGESAPAGSRGTRTPEPVPEPTSGSTREPLPADVSDLGRRDLEIPVEGIKAKQLVRSFRDQRSGGRVHEALDILAPRNTPVRAVEDGKVVKLFDSKAGGITIYQFDPGERFCYYYAHLERYAPGLAEGEQVRRGQLLGYVGTSGNAPKDTPHLHFAVFRLGPEKRWWEGTPIDPYDVLR